MKIKILYLIPFLGRIVMHLDKDVEYQDKRKYLIENTLVCFLLGIIVIIFSKLSIKIDGKYGILLYGIFSSYYFAVIPLIVNIIEVSLIKIVKPKGKFARA